MKPLLIAGRGVFCCPQSCAGEGTRAHQCHFQGQAPDRGGFFSVLNGRNKKFFRKFGKVTKKRLTNHTCYSTIGLRVEASLFFIPHKTA
nr:MAG TPA: hypothetical protein [Caudoviricetes sp.]